MWIYVLLGNILRGIGETPVQPLGISYIDDYAQTENAALYIGNAPYSFAMLVASRGIINKGHFIIIAVPSISGFPLHCTCVL